MERLIIDAAGRRLAADFHPRLTVIGGLDRATREALAGEVIDSLGGARPGVHVELTSAGRSLTVFRPATGTHRVVDTDSVADVTHLYTGPDGTIDVFSSLGVDRTLARRTIRFTAEDLVSGNESDARIARLATVEQDALWDAAMRCRAAEQLLQQASDAAGTSAADAPVVEQVEQSHAELVEATQSYERIRLISLTIATVGAMAGVATSALQGALVGLPFLALALFGVGLGLFFRRSVNGAAAAERAILSGIGADDYGSFHAQRVSSLLDSDNERRRFMMAVSDHRRAAERWTAIAGEIPVAFALDHEDGIRDTAALRRDLHSVAAQAEPNQAVDGSDVVDVAAELVQAVLTRVQAVRALTADDNNLPLIIDDPFTGLDAARKSLLLEALAAHAGNPQMILLTTDPDVTEWARVEAMTGEMAVVEPTIESVDEPAIDAR